MHLYDDTRSGIWYNAAMNLITEPLIFKPIYKDYIWGGTKIASLYNRAGTPGICAESWELSALPDSMSVVAEGSFKGKTLDELVKASGTSLIGSKAPQNDRFPLLFKIIDAKQRLSVQVHPNNNQAEQTDGQAKTEMWYILGCDKGATLFAGLRDDTTEENLTEALENGDIADLLVEIKARPGQSLYIPGGLVHALGAGCVVYEIQQNSNTTYRLFDWNRTDAQGKQRELHIDKSLKTIDWSLPAPDIVEPIQRNERWSDIISNEFFTVRKLSFNGSEEIDPDGSSFIVLFATEGAARVRCHEKYVRLNTGSSALIPACANKCVIESETKAVSLLVTTL